MKILSLAIPSRRAFFRRLFDISLVVLWFTVPCIASGDINSGLVAYYPFNGNANDASGNALNGIINGGVTATTDRPGTANAALAFDGSSGYISISDNHSLLTFDARSQNYTVAAWVELNRASSDQPTIIIDRGTDNSSPTSYTLFYDTKLQRFVAAMWDGTYSGPPSAGVTVMSTSPVAPGEWYHVALVVTNGRMLLYVNGVDETGPGQNGGVVPPNSASYANTDGVRRIGRFAPTSQGGNRYWDGAESDVRIYNRALSSAEIQQLYHRNGSHAKFSISRYVIMGIAILLFVGFAVAVIRLTMPRRIDR